MSKLKNIIFDLGGVLIDIDYLKTNEAFKNLGFNHFEKMFSQFSADKLFEKLETGYISEDDFYKQLLHQQEGISKTDITEAWNAMLMDFRLGSIAFLSQLKPRFQLFLLSNTNIIHQAAFQEQFRAQTGYKSLSELFTKAWYSNEIGLRKPNKEIYEFVLRDAGITAEETLFIDDSYNNIETAKALGFRTHLLVPGEKIEDLVIYE
ncbi:MAG: HAD family phosphatase [Ferruginibacter sp.]